MVYAVDVAWEEAETQKAVLQRMLHRYLTMLVEYWDATGAHAILYPVVLA